MSQLEMIWKPKTMTVPAEIKLKEGYEVRTLTGDMIEGWCEASMELTGDIKWSREEFISNMLLNPPMTLSPKHIFCAIETATGRVVGTASACLDGTKNYGAVHMVTVSPDCKGLGLGKAVCAACVNAFVENGITEAILSTDDFRTPAIAIYLLLGFLPSLFEDDMRGRWTEVLNNMGWKQTVEAYGKDKNIVLLYTPAV
ncbi:MAG: GNAT family N-acetyltransferase [Eubacteriales bacterium]